MSGKSAAVYVRVSTDAQFEEGYSAEAQESMLMAYCQARQISPVEAYIDGGYSGSNLDRPELTRLIQNARAGLISHVIVYKLDRLSRSQKDTLFLIEDIFLPNGIDFVSLGENLDTSTPYGRAMIGILSAFAQLERETIRERTRLGMKERVKSGLWMGGGRVPFGYDYDADSGVLVPNADAPRVRRIYDLFLAGMSTAEIARQVDLPYEKLVRQVLTRKTNIGIITYNGKEYPGKHKPIIDEKTYKKAMAMLSKRSRGTIYASQYLLAGIIYCGVCGARMRYQRWGGPRCKLSCYSRDKSKPHMSTGRPCDNPPIWADEIEKIVQRDLFKFTYEFHPGGDDDTAYNPLEALRKQYGAQSQKLKRLYHLYAQGEDDILLGTINETKAVMDKISEQMKDEQTLADRAAATRDLIGQVRDLETAWPHMTTGERQRIVRALVSRVVITKGDVEITYSV